MSAPIILPQSAEAEARQLLDSTANQITDMLAVSIAKLPVLVGLGRAPTEEACRAAAVKITEMFGGAVLSAIEGEREVEKLKLEIERHRADARPTGEV